MIELPWSTCLSKEQVDRGKIQGMMRSEATMDQADPPIEHDVAAHRFEVRFPDGIAMLKYHYDRLGRLSLDHTEVPPARRHHGVATRLASTALDFAKEQNLTVVPVCPYVIAYLEEHPELAPLVARGQVS
jgi:predicted GNAT family acetyltransferase